MCAGVPVCEPCQLVFDYEKKAKVAKVKGCVKLKILYVYVLPYYLKSHFFQGPCTTGGSALPGLP